MCSLVDIIVAVALGGVLGALIATLSFIKGYDDVLKRIDKLGEDRADEI